MDRKSSNQEKKCGLGERERRRDKGRGRGREGERGCEGMKDGNE